MKKLRHLICGLCLICCISGNMPGSASALFAPQQADAKTTAVADGWRGRQYYRDGQFLTGLHKSQYHQLCWWFGIALPGPFAFPPEGGLTNQSYCYWWPLKSGIFLLLLGISLQSIPFILFFYILLYCCFIYITDCFAIVPSCPKMSIISLPIFRMPIEYH